jgi:hypothetical protein
VACPHETMITPFWVSVGGRKMLREKGGVGRRGYDYHAIWKLRRALQVADACDAC